MSAGRKGHFNKALRIDNEQVRALVAALGSHFDDVSVEVTLKSKRTQTLPNSIRDFTCRQDDPVRRMAIIAQSEDHKRRLSVIISDHWSQSVWLDLAGPKTTADAVDRKLDGWFDSVRPWYARLAVLNPVTVLIVILPWVMLVTAMIRFLLASNYTWGLLFLALSGVVPMAIFSMLRFSFPAVEFDLGQARDRTTQRDAFRWTVVIGLGVSVLASVIAAVFVALLF